MHSIPQEAKASKLNFRIVPRRPMFYSAFRLSEMRKDANFIRCLLDHSRSNADFSKSFESETSLCGE
jgi:hypothetical protein